MKPGICKHYDYKVRNKGICKKGVDVRALVTGPISAWMNHIPCLAHHTQCKPCTKYKEPTGADIASVGDFRWMRNQIDKIAITHNLVARIKRRNLAGTKAAIHCPVCNTKLSFTVARFNGKTSGRCQTKNCVNWSD